MKEGAVEAIIASVSLQDGEDLMDRHAPPPTFALVEARRINKLHLTEAARPLSWSVIPLCSPLPTTSPSICSDLNF